MYIYVYIYIYNYIYNFFPILSSKSISNCFGHYCIYTYIYKNFDRFADKITAKQPPEDSQIAKQPPQDSQT